MRALVMLAITRAPASCWHQRCARLSVIAKIIVFLESMAPALTVCYNWCSVVFSFSSVLVSDGWWISWHWRDFLRAYFSFVLSVTVLVSGCLSWRNRGMIALDNSSYWLSINCSGFLWFPQMWNKVSCWGPIRALSFLLLLVYESSLAW